MAAYMNNIQKSVELCWYIRDGAFISASTFHKHPHFPPDNYCEFQSYAFSLFPQEHSYKCTNATLVFILPKNHKQFPHP